MIKTKLLKAAEGALLSEEALNGLRKTRGALSQYNWHIIQVPIMKKMVREHNGLVVECLTRDRGGTGSSLTVLCSCVKHICPCLVLVKPRKIYPDIIEKLLSGT